MNDAANRLIVLDVRAEEDRGVNVRADGYRYGVIVDGGNGDLTRGHLDEVEAVVSGWLEKPQLCACRSRRAPSRRPGTASLQSLCWSCHSAKSRADQTGRPRRIKGADERGFPLDASSHWYRS